MTRAKALKLLHKNMESPNLRRHCYAVEAVMRSLAKRFGEDVDKWGIVGLLHDGDYEKTRETPEKHTLMMAGWLKKAKVTDKEILSAILSHNYAHTSENPPENRLEWSLYCCDELTGFIVAVALVRPDKKLSSVTVESILKKWGQKAFAAGVKREQIKECEGRLGIPLPDFIDMSLKAMQGIAKDLGL